MISWIFYYNLILQSFIASILVINNIDYHYMINKISNEDSRFYGWLAVQYTMIMMPLGMLFVVMLFGYKNNRAIFQKYVHAPIIPLLSPKDNYIKYSLYIFYTISILSVLYVMITLKTIPLSGIFQGLGQETLNILRQDASRNFPGNLYIKNIFALGLTPILSYIAFSYYKMTKNKIDLYWFILLFIASFMILTYNIAKAPFIQYLLGFIFLNILINGRIQRKTLIILSIIILGLLVTVYLLLAGSSGISFTHLFHYNTGILGRIILSQAAGTYLNFDLFPHIYDHIGFNSVSHFLSNLFGLEYSERSSRLIMMHIYPQRVANGTIGVANSLFIGEAWANFGLIGVLLAPFYVGMLIQSIYMFFLSTPKTPLFLGLFTFFSYKGSVTGGFNDYIYNMSYITLVFIFLWIYTQGFILKQICKENKCQK